jgi:acetyltransferase-like isoleucine patch superfamily enzyme
LGLASVATRDLKPWTVYSGNPAVAVRERERTIPLDDVHPAAPGGDV